MQIPLVAGMWARQQFTNSDIFREVMIVSTFFCQPVAKLDPFVNISYTPLYLPAILHLEHKAYGKGRNLKLG